MYEINNEYIHHIKRVCEAVIDFNTSQCIKSLNDRRIALKTLKYINRLARDRHTSAGNALNKRSDSYQSMLGETKE